MAGQITEGQTKSAHNSRRSGPIGDFKIHSLRIKNSDTISGNNTRNLVTAVGTGTHG